MKIYILRPICIENNNPFEGYDKVFGFVIRAKNESEARKIANQNAGNENGSLGVKNPWLDINYSTCEVLSKTGESEVIMSDFVSG